jgi:hypothetical protein
MQFQYQITVEDFVAGQMLYHRLSSGNKYLIYTIGWMLAGALFVFVAVTEKLVDISPILLGAIGIWWIYAGVRGLFPRRYLRRSYSGQALDGEQYRANVNEDGFEIVSELRRWYVRWAAVGPKGEDDRVFAFYASNTIFIFGKRYLTLEQQAQLRTLAVLPPDLEVTAQR